MMDTIERSGPARKPRNEYVSLPQFWGVRRLFDLRRLTFFIVHELESKSSTIHDNYETINYVL